MSGFRIRGTASSAGYQQRPIPVEPHSDFYDDRRSRSPSRERDRRYGSPRRRHTPELSRTPPNDPSADNKYHSSYDDYGHYERNEPRHERPSSPLKGRHSYRDRDHERYRSPSYKTRTRSRSESSRDSRPSSMGNPSKEIIMEGLAAHLKEDDVRYLLPRLSQGIHSCCDWCHFELQQHYKVDGLDYVRIIRDRLTRQSRQFGFLRFTTIEHAESFMNQNYPSIYLYGRDEISRDVVDNARVSIAYSRERKDINSARGELDWICTFCDINNFATRPRCFRCGTSKPDSMIQPPVKVSNTGDNDASPDSTPSQFLLFRGLEVSVTEELFAKGVEKLFKPPGFSASAPGNQSAGKKIAKVASTTGDANLGAREGTLRRVLLVRDRRSNDSWKYGFAEFATIDDAQSALIRYNSYERFTIASKQVLVSYIHAGVFAPIFNPTASTFRFTFSPLDNPSIKLSYWDEAAYVTELEVSSGEAPSTEGKAGAKINVPSADSEGMKSIKETEKTKKRKAEVGGSSTAPKKAAPSHLQFWSNRHAELHGLDQKAAASVGSEDYSASPDRDVAPPTQSFLDPNRNCCYLCSRQFNSTAEANRHERLSKLHRQNLEQPALVQKAFAKLEKHGIQSQQASQEYRDRAKERRKVYGVVNRKGEQVGNRGKANKHASDDDEPVVQSKGASLLSKMGYTTGQGLGASGEGMTAPISQNVYAAGVGLGAEGGKLGNAVQEAERKTKGDHGAPGEFAERTREIARERYSRM